MLTLDPRDCVSEFSSQGAVADPGGVNRVTTCHPHCLLILMIFIISYG